MLDFGKHATIRGPPGSNEPALSIMSITACFEQLRNSAAQEKRCAAGCGAGKRHRAAHSETGITDHRQKRVWPNRPAKGCCVLGRRFESVCQPSYVWWSFVVQMTKGWGFAPDLLVRPRDTPHWWVQTNFGPDQTTEPPGHKPLVVNRVVVGLFEEEEEGTGIASDIVKVEGAESRHPRSLDLRNDTGTVISPTLGQQNKTTHTLLCIWHACQSGVWAGVWFWGLS